MLILPKISSTMLIKITELRMNKLFEKRFFVEKL